MHYLDEGKGPVVLLLHGNPTWCFYFRNLIELLKGDFRVIAPDYIGCGLSDHPAEAHFRARQRIEHLEEFTAKLGLERFSLVMHDWGGGIGTGLAVDHPEAVEKLVYLNTTLTETESLPLLIKAAAHPLVGKYLTKYSRRFLKFTTSLGVSRKLSKEVRKAYHYPYRTRARRGAIWDFVADIPFNDSHPSYAEMLGLADKLPRFGRTPVQIVWGLKDPCFHRGMLNKVMAHFPHANVLEIPEASHLVLEDAPDLAGRTIRDFLLGEFRATELRKAATPNSLYRAFMQTAATCAGSTAIVVPSFFSDSVKYAQIKYSDLAVLVNQYQRGLTDLGLSRGDKVLMLVSPGIDFLALSYAVMGRGAVPVYLDPGMGRDRLLACIAGLNADAFIGSLRAQPLRLFRARLFPRLKFSLCATDWSVPGTVTTGFLKKFSSKPLPEEGSSGMCLIAYTSGATGTPRGVVFSDGMITRQLSIFREVFGFEAGKKDLPLLPVFSLFGAALGVCSVFAQVDPARPLALDPSKVVKIVNDLGIESSFGSPTLWNKISEYCIRSRAVLPSIERVYMAGAPVSPRVLERLQQILERGEAFTPYGATEALPVTLISAGQIRAAEMLPARGGEIGTLVGRAVPGVEIRVIRHVSGAIAHIASAQACRLGEIGEVIVMGDNVSRSYFRQPEADALSKIQDGERFWHRMGDMGYLDGEGNLYFCGRKAHVVECGGKVYYSIPTERVFNQHPKVARSALVALHGGKEAAIVVEPYPQYWPDGRAERKAFAGELAKLAKADPIASSIAKFFFHQSFPVDGRHNAKIFRDRLGLWASELDSYSGSVER